MELYKYKNDSENKKNVLRIIYNEEGISRNELVDRTGLSLVTITKFVSELINDGVVEEYGTLESTGGRKSSTLRINPDFAYIIGIDIGAFSTKIGVVCINGEVIERVCIPALGIPAKGISFEGICIKIDEIIKKHGHNRLLGIGIGISGMVKPDEGKVVFCPNISEWDGVDVAKLLEERFTVPAFLDTSSRCMALAEQWFGVGRGVKNQIFVSIGYGSIGAGIIIESVLFEGSGGFAGELGHVQVDENGIRCTCGNYGCLELYVTLYMLRSNIAYRLGEYKGYSPLKLLADSGRGINEDVIKDALKDGDKIVYEELMNAGKLIGVALSNMVNVINPELVILGGGVIENFPIIVDKVERVLKERTLIPIQQNLSIKKSSLGWDASIKGSAILLINRFLG